MAETFTKSEEIYGSEISPFPIIVLISPNGTKFILTVDDLGILTTTPL